MPEMTSYEPGTPSWVDVSAPDVKTTAAFYSSLFGWDFQDAGPDAGGYGMFLLNGKTVAGIGPIMAEGQPAVWTTYVSTDNADAAVERIQANGGSVFVPPMDVMEAGRMAIAADPTGAVFGMWQPKQMPGADLVNDPGAFCWNELATRDTKAAESFYSAVFGWGASTNAFGEMTYTEWKVGDRSIGGMMPMGADFPAEVPPNWLVYFAVTDCDAAVAKAQELGGGVAAPAMEIENVGRFAVLTDPNGAVFAVIKPSQQ
jgi:predicted enzyme related to lactoylglutathione lyase